MGLIPPPNVEGVAKMPRRGLIPCLIAAYSLARHCGLVGFPPCSGKQQRASVVRRA